MKSQDSQQPQSLHINQVFKRSAISVIVRAFPSTILKNLVFTISKSNFITYNTPLYNTIYIKTSIFFLPFHLNIVSLLFFNNFLFFLSPLSLSFSQHRQRHTTTSTHHHWYNRTQQSPHLTANSHLTQQPTTTTNPSPTNPPHKPNHKPPQHSHSHHHRWHPQPLQIGIPTTQNQIKNSTN